LINYALNYSLLEPVQTDLSKHVENQLFKNVFKQTLPGKYIGPPQLINKYKILLQKQCFNNKQPIICFFNEYFVLDKPVNIKCLSSLCLTSNVRKAYTMSLHTLVYIVNS